jgi:hypothetical protein
VAFVGERRGAHRILVTISEGKMQLGKSWSRWNDNIKIYLKQTDGIAWIELIWLRYKWQVPVNTVKNLRVP